MVALYVAIWHACSSSFEEIEYELSGDSQLHKIHVFCTWRIPSDRELSKTLSIEQPSAKSGISGYGCDGGCDGGCAVAC